MIGEDIMGHIDQITSKRISEMTEDEKAYLRARVSYLNDTQLETYKEILSPAELPLPNMTYKQLQQEASRLGMGKTVGKTTEELEAFIKSN